MAIGAALVFTTRIRERLGLGLRVRVWVAAICGAALPFDTLLTSLTVPVRTAATAITFLTAFTVVTDLTSFTVSVGAATTAICLTTNAPVTVEAFPTHLCVPTAVPFSNRSTLHAVTGLTASAIKSRPTEVLRHAFSTFPVTTLPFFTVVVG